MKNLEKPVFYPSMWVWNSLSGWLYHPAPWKSLEYPFYNPICWRNKPMTSWPGFSSPGRSGCSPDMERRAPVACLKWFHLICFTIFKGFIKWVHQVEVLWKLVPQAFYKPKCGSLGHSISQTLGRPRIFSGIFWGQPKKANSLALSHHFINRSWTLPPHRKKWKTWKNPYSIHLCEYKMVFLGDYTILPLGNPWNTNFITPYAEETSQWLHGLAFLLLDVQAALLTWSGEHQ